MVDNVVTLCEDMMEGCDMDCLLLLVRVKVLVITGEED
jgi:hypothetical protein